jgi:hypothetical protein
VSASPASTLLEPSASCRGGFSAWSARAGPPRFPVLDEAMSNQTFIFLLARGRDNREVMACACCLWISGDMPWNFAPCGGGSRRHQLFKPSMPPSRVETNKNGQGCCSDRFDPIRRLCAHRERIRAETLLKAALRLPRILKCRVRYREILSRTLPPSLSHSLALALGGKAIFKG